MREILFRGKRIDNGKWIEGLPYKAKYGGISSIVDIDEERHLIIPETVGQYTGLTDKNGKRIFEGDIVKCIEITRYKEIEYISPVVFLDGSWFLHESEDCDVYLYNYDTEGIERLWEIEVIGNIHDNPELLEGGTE